MDQLAVELPVVELGVTFNDAVRAGGVAAIGDVAVVGMTVSLKVLTFAVGIAVASAVANPDINSFGVSFRAGIYSVTGLTLESFVIV